MELDEYLECLGMQIRNLKARKAIVQEVEGHIYEQIQDYEAQGMEHQRAVSEAVRQMGDPVETGVEMDRIHRPKMEWKLFWCIVAFSIFGLFLQYVCFYGIGEEIIQYQTMVGSADSTFYRQCIYTGLGLMAMLGVCFWDYSRIGKHGGMLGAGLLAGVSILCAAGGILPKFNGGHPYMRCFLYLFIPLFGGILYKNRGKGCLGIGICLLWIAALFFTGTAMRSGLGIVLDSVIVCYGMLLLAIGKRWFGTSRKMEFVLALAFGLLAGGVWAARNTGYYQARLFDAIHPQEGADAGGYLNSLVREMVRQFSMDGKSHAVLENKNLIPWKNISGIHYDFMFLQIASELGVVKASFICGGLICMMIGMFRTVMRQKNQMGQMMGLGCVMILALETVRTILNNVGFYMASTGGLMFFSYGKIHTIVVYLLLGVVLSVYRFKDLVWEEQENAVANEKGVLAVIGRYRIKVEKM